MRSHGSTSKLHQLSAPKARSKVPCGTASAAFFPNFASSAVVARSTNQLNSSPIKAKKAARTTSTRQVPKLRATKSLGSVVLPATVEALQKIDDFLRENKMRTIDIFRRRDINTSLMPNDAIGNANDRSSWLQTEKGDDVIDMGEFLAFMKRLGLNLTSETVRIAHSS